MFVYRYATAAAAVLSALRTGVVLLSSRVSGQVVHDLLRFTETDRAEIVTLLEKPAVGAATRAGGAGPAATLNTRLSLPTDELDVQLKQLGGSSAWFKVWPRDISQTGLGFIHGAFVHPGVTCVLALTSLAGIKVHIAAKVARCEHIKGRAHFVGVRFDESLALHEYVPGIEPPAEKEKGPDGKAKPGKATHAELRTMVGQLVSLSAAKDCPAPIRKLLKQLAEALGAA